MEPLPLDILLYIIDLLAEDVNSLRILSLTCKSMVPLCRKHLFSYLSLASHPLKILKRFNDLHSTNPDIARYVRRLDYIACIPVFTEELKFLHILTEHSSLQRIRLRSLRSSWPWNNLPNSLRSSLISLIQLPTVFHLDIEDLNGFPATALSGCSNLIDLWLRNLEFSPPEVNQVISRSKVPTPVSLHIRGPREASSYDFAAFLNSASLHTGGPIVDFSRLQKAEFDVSSRDDIDHVNKLITATTRLEYFSIDSLIVNQPVDLTGLGASLAINAYRTLKILELSLTVVGDDYDPLCGFDRELRFIAGNNILEVLKLYLVVRDDATCRTESEDWSSFDSVLTESDAFPMLHQALINICWGPTSRFPSELAMLEILLGDKFPRLMESKAVEFKFCASLRNYDGAYTSEY